MENKELIKLAGIGESIMMSDRALEKMKEAKSKLHDAHQIIQQLTRTYEPAREAGSVYHAIETMMSQLDNKFQDEIKHLQQIS